MHISNNNRQGRMYLSNNNRQIRLHISNNNKQGKTYMGNVNNQGIIHIRVYEEKINTIQYMSLILTCIETYSMHSHLHLHGNTRCTNIISNRTEIYVMLLSLFLTVRKYPSCNTTHPHSMEALVMQYHSYSHQAYVYQYHAR